MYDEIQGDEFFIIFMIHVSTYTCYNFALIMSIYCVFVCLKKVWYLSLYVVINHQVPIISIFMCVCLCECMPSLLPNQCKIFIKLIFKIACYTIIFFFSSFLLFLYLKKDIAFCFLGLNLYSSYLHHLDAEITGMQLNPDYI